MHALTERLDAATPSLFAGTPRMTLAALGALLIVCISLAQAAAIPPWAVAVAAVVAGHGALLVTALAWRNSDRVRSRWSSPLLVLPLLAIAALATIAHPSTAAAAAVVPVWLWARGPRANVEPRYIAAGAAVGASLGAHLLITASFTLGYQAVFDVARAVSWLAYDACISVPATECFFRGALFDRAQRRWPMPAATAVAASLGVVRYLLDPLLPMTAELVAGTVFYTGLLGVANCWLFHRTGSVIPGAVGAVVFFAAYRAVAP